VYECSLRQREPRGLATLRIGFDGVFYGWFDILLIGEEKMRETITPTGWVIRTKNSDRANYCAVLKKG